VYVCYIDEAGCPGTLPSATSDIQPFLVLTALFVPQDRLRELTLDFLHLKSQFNPGLATGLRHWLDISKREIKGADLRRNMRSKGRNRRRATALFLDKTLQLLLKHDAKIVAKIFIKEPGVIFEGIPAYSASVQGLCKHFHTFLEHKKSDGFVIADSRTATLNSGISHSIFTMKFRTVGDAYPRILEMPTFGHSENHVPIQISDFICSAILAPIATSTYCQGHVKSVHVNSKDKWIRTHFAPTIKTLCFRYKDVTSNKPSGGITVSDRIGYRPGSAIFSSASALPAVTNPSSAPAASGSIPAPAGLAVSIGIVSIAAVMAPDNGGPAAS